MAMSLCEIDSTGTLFAIADRNEVFVYDWKSLHLVWRQTFPSVVVGLGTVNNGSMVICESGRLTRLDWSRGEVLAETTVAGNTTGLATTIHGDIAVFFVSSVVVIVGGETVATISLPNITCGAWSPNGSSLAIGNEQGQFLVYERDDFERSSNLVPIATSSFEQRIDSIACQGYDPDYQDDYWKVAVGSSIWTIVPRRKIRELFAHNLPGTVTQLSVRGMVAFANRSHLTVFKGAIRQVNLGVQEERDGRVIADIDYHERTVTGLIFAARNELLIGLDHGEGNIVNFADGELFRTSSHSSRPDVHRNLQWNCQPQNIPGFQRLPELNLDVKPRLKWRMSTKDQLPWWIVPIVGTIAGTWFGRRIAVNQPYWETIILVTAFATTGFVTGLIIFAFVFWSNPRR